MSHRPFCYFIEIQDSSGTVVLARWQTRWVEQTITWNGYNWRYLAGVAASGVVSGQTLGNQATITVPFTMETNELARQILVPPAIAIITKNDLGDAIDTSQMLPIAETMGQIIQVNRTDTEFKFSLGSPLSPIGASFPPRSATSELIGNGVIL